MLPYTPSLEMLQRTTQYLPREQSSETSHPLRRLTSPLTQAHSKKAIHQLMATRNVLSVMPNIGCPIVTSFRRSLWETDLISSAPRTFAITALCLATSRTLVQKKVSATSLVAMSTPNTPPSCIQRIMDQLLISLPEPAEPVLQGLHSKWTIRGFTMALSMEEMKL